MKKLLGWAAALALLASIFPAPAGAKVDKADGKIRVLIIDGQNNHNWRATTPHLKKVLEDSGRFTVDVATAPERPGGKDQEKTRAYREAMEKFHPDLSRYDVVLSNYNGDRWSRKLDSDLTERLRNGKIGLVIVHAANNSFPGWKEYDEMIGLGWRGNTYGERLYVDEQGKEVRVPRGQGPGSGHGPQHAFLITVRDPDHPITRDMPRTWLHAQDELYQGLRGPIGTMHLLATAYADKSKHGTGENEPMIWTMTFGKGRVFHTPMGHDLNSMRCVGFITTLRRGTEWAATGKVTIPIPENFPTATKTSLLGAK